VAEASGVNMVVVSRVERGEVRPRESTVEKLAAFYEKSGIEFLPDNGVCERRSVSSRMYQGERGFIAFARDVVETVREVGGEVCVSNVDERMWDRWLGGYREEYLAAMGALGNFTSRLLVRAGDAYTIAPYAEYRSVDEASFGWAPFYVYGDKVAMILFKEEDCIVVVITNREIADAQRRQFGVMWRSAKPPDGSGRIQK
jgi:transcriptional regulator with XRE-family HTH domain